jgi:NAD(P)-dependent dehydrogenase (short-subunit alcohol dehydrogenase family)
VKLKNTTAPNHVAANNEDETAVTSSHHHEERIKYHELDLSSMQDAWNSAQEFKKLENRLDILVCNAGVSMTTLQKLSPDGYDMMFAVNHLGHFAFTLGLLGEYTTSFITITVSDRSQLISNVSLRFD